MAILPQGTLYKKNGEFSPSELPEALKVAITGNSVLNMD